MKKLFFIMMLFSASQFYAISYVGSMLFLAEGCFLTLATQRISSLQKELIELNKDEKHVKYTQEVLTQKIKRWKNIRDLSFPACFLSYVGFNYFSRKLVRAPRPAPAAAAAPLRAPVTTLSDLDQYVPEAWQKYGTPDKCPVCLEYEGEVFDQSKWTIASLICQHLLCKDCKKNCIRSATGRPKCPECRRDMD